MDKLTYKYKYFFYYYKLNSVSIWFSMSSFLDLPIYRIHRRTLRRLPTIVLHMHSSSQEFLKFTLINLFVGAVGTKQDKINLAL